MLVRMRRIWRWPPPRLKDFRADLPAGLAGGLSAIPDGMAGAVMAGVNPIHGIYASIVGRVVGGLSTSSALMCVTTTGAISITVAEAMEGIPEAQRAGALATLVLLAGLVQLALGLLRLGFLVRFVSNTVTTGFLCGIAVTIVLSQLGDLTGYLSAEDHRLLRLYDLATHLEQVDLPTLQVGALTLGTVALLGRTRLASLAMLIALALATLVTHGLGLDKVRLVSDVYSIPSGLPLPILPDLAALPRVTFAAVAVAVVGLLQGASVSHSYPNPDGRYPNTSADFIGQGIANLACGVLRGLPVGGSIGQTALLVNAGARTRWATLISGLTAALAILLLVPLVGALPMAGMAGLLVMVGFRALPVEQIQVIWRSGRINAAIMGMTFIATLILPIEQAVALSVLVTFVLQVFRAANRLQLMQLIPRAGGLYEERKPPERLPDRSVTVLYPIGSLFFAGAQVLESQLPDPDGTERPVVLLVLRGHKEMGSTFIGVVDRYARKLRARGGKLVLVGVSERVMDQLRRTRLLKRLERRNVYRATPLLGETRRKAYRDAERWLAAEAAAERRLKATGGRWLPPDKSD